MFNLFKTKKKIHLDNFSRILCGKFRPNHFKGVINVINRFLEIIKPKSSQAERDEQQLMLIKSHIIKNKIKTQESGLDNISRTNGVALSSRNSKLNKNQLRLAV